MSSLFDDLSLEADRRALVAERERLQGALDDVDLEIEGIDEIRRSGTVQTLDASVVEVMRGGS